LTAAPASQTAAAGSKAVYLVSVTPSGGFSGSISLGAVGLPRHLRWLQSNCDRCFRIIDADSQYKYFDHPGQLSPKTITGSSTGPTETAPVTLVVTPVTHSACGGNKDGLINSLDVQISAANAARCASNSAFATFATQVPDVVSGVLGSCRVTSGLHTVALNWTASTASGVTYNVYRETASGGENYGSPLPTRDGNNVFYGLHGRQRSNLLLCPRLRQRVHVERSFQRSGRNDTSQLAGQIGVAVRAVR
jgi:hypothetical protein